MAQEKEEVEEVEKEQSDPTESVINEDLVAESLHACMHMGSE